MVTAGCAGDVKTGGNNGLVKNTKPHIFYTSSLCVDILFIINSTGGP